MKKLILLPFLLAFTPASYADLSHQITSSVSLKTGGASTSATRIGSSYSISGSGVDTTHGTGDSAVSNGIGALTFSSGIGTPANVVATQDVPANTFSFSQSFTQADVVPTSAVTTGASPNFSDVTSIAGGTPSNLAGTISTAGAITLTAGGENTEAVGQVITSLYVD